MLQGGTVGTCTRLEGGVLVWSKSLRFLSKNLAPFPSTGIAPEEHCHNPLQHRQQIQQVRQQAGVMRELYALCTQSWPCALCNSVGLPCSISPIACKVPDGSFPAPIHWRGRHDFTGWKEEHPKNGNFCSEREELLSLFSLFTKATPKNVPRCLNTQQ